MNGVATITGLSIDKVGTGYTLVASSGSLAGATSASFAITAGAPAQYIFPEMGAAVVAAVGTTITIRAQLADEHGNAVAAPRRMVNFVSTNGGTFPSGQSANTDANGVAQVSFTVSTTSATTHTATATDGSGSTGTSPTIVTTTSGGGGGGGGGIIK